MKKIITILCALVLIGVGRTEASIGTPDVTTSSWLNVPVTCLDTVAGVQRIPDSAHVVVFFGNSPNDLAYAARSTDPGAEPAWIDSVAYAGNTFYYFWDQIADIDADSGAGFYSGVVSLFTQGYPTDNYFSFNLVDTTAQEYGSLNYFKTKNLPTDPADDSDIDAQLLALAVFLGANDGYYQKLFPLGSANKDSVEVYDSGDNLLGTLYYFHTGAVIDSVRWEIW